MADINKTCESTVELADKVYALFMERGYKLEQGTKEGGIYANGSGAMRALLGGFAKRNKFLVKITQNPEANCVISFNKAITGAMGGAIGVSKLNKEFKTIHGLLVNL